MPLDFSDLILDDLSPIYLQIIRYVKFQIVAGKITSGDEMPSRRLLSAMLGVNPNTIQKAYKQIEEEGLMVSFAGSKSLLQFSTKKVEEIRNELLSEETMKFVTALQCIGLDLSSAHELLNQVWDKTSMGGVTNDNI